MLITASVYFSAIPNVLWTSRDSMRVCNDHFEPPKYVALGVYVPISLIKTVLQTHLHSFTRASSPIIKLSILASVNNNGATPLTPACRGGGFPRVIFPAADAFPHSTSRAVSPQNGKPV